MFRHIYTFGIQLYSQIILMASFVGPKAKSWIKGRQKQSKDWHNQNFSEGEWIWFHAASLGEFEQGRPLMEAIKTQHPRYKILLTFFSPSGYEVRKNYEFADQVAYLPADTPKNAKAFVGLFNLKAVFFIKYEFWFNFMLAIHQKNIPLYFIAAKFRAKQHFFRWYGGWARKQLQLVTHFYVQDELSALLLKDIDVPQTSVSGDTRFDRVFQLSQNALQLHVIECFKANRRLFVIGSSWPEDEKMLLPIIAELESDIAVVIAPHDISSKHIQNIEAKLKTSFVRYSDFSDEKQVKVLIIDNIGMLSSIYKYADFAYIGGGFGKSIHNIQEAVTYGCPVIVGPQHKRFSEAVDLIDLGGVFAVSNANALFSIVHRLIRENDFREKASEICRSYVAKQIGATEKIMLQLFPDH